MERRPTPGQSTNPLQARRRGLAPRPTPQGPSLVAQVSNRSTGVLLCLVVVLQVSTSQTVTYNTPWPVCRLPPKVLQERTGVTTEKVLSICLTTYSGLQVTFDNADRFYIGNSASVIGVNTACFKLDKIVMVQEFNGTYAFFPGGNIPAQAVDQAWDLSLWPKYNPNFQQSVNLTISNFGTTNLHVTGIDSASPNKDFPTGQASTILLDYSKVNLIFNSLPILQEYLLGASKPNISPGVVTAIAMIKNLPSTPGAVNQLITYALVVFDPGNPVSEWNFFLYETTVTLTYSTRASAGGRRLLVATAKNTAPPTACSKACCKAASPLPKGCAKGGKIYPACLKKCACACR